MKGKGVRVKGKAERLRPALALAQDRRSPFARIEDAFDAIRAGRMVIVVDDPDRCKVRRKSRARSTVTRQCKGLASGRLTQRAPPIYKASGTRPVLCRIM